MFNQGWPIPERVARKAYLDGSPLVQSAKVTVTYTAE